MTVCNFQVELRGLKLWMHTEIHELVIRKIRNNKKVHRPKSVNNSLWTFFFIIHQSYMTFLLYLNAAISTAWAMRPTALMMETVSTSEMSVSFYETTCHNIPEDRHLQMILFHIQKHLIFKIQFNIILQSMSRSSTWSLLF
jgi:hypothetical protein